MPVAPRTEATLELPGEVIAKNGLSKYQGRMLSKLHAG
jgi:hypothetical protein